MNTILVQKLTMLKTEIIIYSLFVGLICLMLSYHDVYLTITHHSIHIHCVYLDSFILGFLTSIIILWWLVKNQIFQTTDKQILMSLFVGIVCGGIGTYTQLFPLWF